MPNKFKYLLLLLIAIGVLLPEPASAIIGTGLFDIFDHMLHGISEKTGIMAAVIILTLAFYAVGLGLLFASINVLEIFITQQTLWLIQLQPMTQAGWDFVVGLANMLLIVVFIIIAFALIFKLENFQTKKALPMLLIVAFLLNFSLLFVNMIIDVSQIIFTTILNALDEDFWPMVKDAIMGPLWPTLIALIVLIAGLIVIFSIPIASTFGQIIFASIFIPIILPFLMLIFVQMMLFYPLALMFAVFAFLFAARVFVLQILAVLAPLAFISLILPQTRFFWTFWLKTFTQWIFLGIFFLFLLVLGFSMLAYLTPTFPAPSEIEAPTILAPIIAVFRGIISFAVYYFSVFVYVTVILYIGKKFLPEGAQGVISAVEGAGKLALTKGGGLAAKGMTKGGLALRKKALSRAERKQGEKATRLDATTQRLRSAEGQGREEEYTGQERKDVGISARPWVHRGKLRGDEVGKAAEKAEKAHKKAIQKKGIFAGQAQDIADQEKRKHSKEVEGKTNYQLENELAREQLEPRITKNLSRIAAAMDELAKRGKISGHAENAIVEAIKGGANASLIMNRRPDLAPQLGKSIAEELAKRDPEDLRRNMQKEAGGNLDVAKFFVENEAYAREMGQKGKQEVKIEILKTIEKHLKVSNDPELKKKFNDNIVNNPNSSWGYQATDKTSDENGMDY